MLLRTLGQILDDRSHGDRLGDLPHPRQHPGLWGRHASVRSREVHHFHANRWSFKQSAVLRTDGESESEGSPSGCCA